MDLFNYRRRATTEVHVGGTPMGGDNTIRVQSMTTTPTADVAASTAQAERIADAGGEYVRLTTQGVREAESLKDIKARMRADGYATPIVADVHFNPHVAEVAALHADKVRINPGNYVDPARTFRHLEYTDEEYADELKKIEERFVPLLRICREHHTALRIGVNHGSLSDRIMSRYGDTPEGIVESCMEFLRICRRESFADVVISIKASNTVVMVRSVRLLVSAMEREGMDYPLHLGVTEAGEGEDGRIKSAVGIGALLADGLGDTVRVSLSEEPEAEIPVARHLVDYVTARAGHTVIPGQAALGFDWLRPERRATTAVGNIGGSHVPVVIASMLGGGDPSALSADGELVPDYVYTGQQLPSHRLEGQRYIVDFNVYGALADSEGVYPIFPYNAVPFISTVKADVKFLVLPYGADADEYTACLKAHPEVVVISVSNHANRLGEQRALAHEMMAAGLQNPIVFCQAYRHAAEEKGDFQLEAASDMGALMFDGLTDGLWLMNDGTLPAADVTATAFGILQAARLRTSKTEYISCPGCGRTLYDLRSTIAYVGAGRGRISLYKGKQCVEKNIPEEEAVEHLLRLINEG